MWVDDIGTILVNAGVGALGTSIFASTAAKIPTGTGPYLSIIETPGFPTDRLQSATPNTQDYKRPAAQIVVRASSYSAAQTMARSAWNALAAIRNVVVGTTYHMNILPQQEPFDLGTDDTNGRAMVAFNVRGYNRPA